MKGARKKMPQYLIFEVALYFAKVQKSLVNEPGCRFSIMVPETGLEPVRVHHPRDFKSLASTIPPLGH